MESAPPPGNQWEHYGRSRQMWQYDISPSHRSVSSEVDDDDTCVMIKCVFFCVCVCGGRGGGHWYLRQISWSVGDPREWQKMINFSRRSVGVFHHNQNLVHFLFVVHHHGDLHHQNLVEMRRNPFGLIITLPCSHWSLQPQVVNHGMMELLHPARWAACDVSDPH